VKYSLAKVVQACLELNVRVKKVNGKLLVKKSDLLRVTGKHKAFAAAFCPKCGYGFGGKKRSEYGDTGTPITLPYEENKPCPDCLFLQYSGESTHPTPTREMTKENKYWASFVTDHTPSALIGPIYSRNAAQEAIEDISKLDEEIYKLQDRLQNSGSPSPEGKKLAKEYGDALRGKATIIDENKDGSPDQENWAFVFPVIDIKSKYKTSIDQMKKMADEMEKEGRTQRPETEENLN